MKILFYDNKVLMFSILLLFTGLKVGAQSNTFIDSYLLQKEAAYNETAFLVLSAAGKVQETYSTDEVMKHLEEMKIQPREGAIRLGDYSLLLMKGFEIPGGIFWSIFKTRRYAVRELAFRGYLNGSRDPGRKITPDEALSILGRVIAWKEVQK